MSSVDILRDELTNDPLARGYAGMTTDQKIASLNALDRDLAKSSLTGDEIFQATDSTEWLAMVDADQQLWVSFCARSSLDPFGSANVAFVTNLFGGGSTTLANLNALRTVANGQSRAQELGIGEVGPGLIENAEA